VAAKDISTDVPNEQYPCLSGGETDINATSIGIIPFLKSAGTSLKNMGM